MNTDRELRERIRRELALEPGVDIDAVQVVVDDGTVTLTGQVESLSAMHFAESCVMRVEGARAVINQLSVQASRGRTGSAIAT